MARRKRNKDLWKYIGLAVLAVVTLGVVAASFLQPTPTPPVTAASTQTATPTAKATRPVLQKLVIPEGTKTVFFGDSWTAGYAAAPSENGFAYLTGSALGLDYAVDASGSGTGYLNPGPNNAGTYATRLDAKPVDAAVKLLVIQGGLNDQGQQIGKFVDEAKRTITIAKAKFPAAQIVVMGPISPTRTAGNDVVTIDASLQGIAEANGLHYVSGHQERWITPENLAATIDASKASHPSTAGHDYLAQRLIAKLRQLAA